MYLPNESTKHTAYGIALAFLIEKRFALDEININDIDDDTMPMMIIECIKL